MASAREDGGFQSPWGRAPEPGAPPPPGLEEPADEAEGELSDEPEQEQFPCAQCGAILEFAPGTSALRCAYCGHENEIPKLDVAIQELDFRAALARGGAPDETEEITTVKCGSCAAEFTLDAQTRADDCPFCGSHIVREPETQTHLKPRSLLPFRITKREARDRFRDWLGRLWFAPNALKRMARQEGAFTGMYVPYWTYDSDTVSRYHGQRGTKYMVPQTFTTTVNGKRVTQTRMVTKIRWRPVSGVVNRAFDDVLVLASRSLPHTYAERLEPWDLPGLAAYDHAYLSGFQAENYRVGLEEGFEDAKRKMDTLIRVDVRRQIGGDAQRIHSLTTMHRDVTYKHILLPIWINTYRFARKSYTFVINGRTGEVQGQRPWSWVKIGLAALAVLVVAGVVWYLTQG